MSSQQATCNIDYSGVLNKVVTLWTESGAQLRNAPEHRSYFLRQIRSPEFRLYLEYGVPMRVYTPEDVIEIRTTQHGKVSKFAKEMMKTFVLRAVEPHDIDITEFDKVATHHSSMTLSIDGVKCT